MSIEKQYTKNKSSCKVTFIMPKEATMNAKKVFIAGEFNDWEKKEMTKNKKDNSYSITISLGTGKEYQFRYNLTDGKNDWWENDWNADKYTPAPYGGENSVVIV
jgi:1,4-alpha-glucan branching enzyme